MQYHSTYTSPVGPLLLTASETGLTGLWMDGRNPPPDSREGETEILRRTSCWLDGYFRGTAGEMDIPLEPDGTDFQAAVWNILLTIPYGTLRTYGDIAREIALVLGKKTMSAQAVGGAVGKNPISILIPCHRVIGSNGKLTGYAGGLDKKQWLLQLEGWELQHDQIRKYREERV